MNLYFNISTTGNKVLIRDTEGDRINRNFTPVFYKKAPHDLHNFKSINGENLQPIDFENMAEANDFKRKYIDSEFYGNHTHHVSYIQENYDKAQGYDFDAIRICTIDIEVLSDAGFPHPKDTKYPITAIAAHFSDLGWKQWGLKKDYTPQDDLEYFQFESERELLQHFLRYWGDNCPHILTSWNGDMFDVPYIVNRTKKILSKNSANLLSPFGKITERVIRDNFGSEQTTYKIWGVEQLDYLALYKKFTYVKPPNYKLDTIGEIECGINKLDFNGNNTFAELYTNDYQRYMDYNRHDCQIILDLNKKLNLLELTVDLAYYAGVNYSDVFSPVRTWDAIIANKLLLDRVIVPLPKSPPPAENYGGGFVLDPKLGLQKWVMSFDLASLYPSLIRGFNIGFDTISHKEPEYGFEDVLEGLEFDKSGSHAPNGWVYNNDEQSLYSKLMEDLYLQRKNDKNQMLDFKVKREAITDTASKEYEKLTTDISIYDTKQMGKKILLNSLYGILGSRYFRFFDVRLAESITSAGRMAIQYITHRTSEYINEILKTDGVDYIIAVDTDSQYIDANGFVELYKKANPDATTDQIVNYLDKVGNKLNLFIDEAYLELKDQLNLKEHQLIMDREGIFGKGAWTAKKRYFLSCYDMEGVRYATPKLKIMGLETQRSTTPKMFKSSLKEMLELIVSTDNDTLIEEITKIKVLAEGAELDDLASPTGCNNLKKWSDENGYPRKGSPGHIRAAITYNRVIKSDPVLSAKYPLIEEGEKVKVLFLKDPNPLGEKQIAYPAAFPIETGLMKYIDRDRIYDKKFIQPLETILNSIEWETEHKNTLDMFF